MGILAAQVVDVYGHLRMVDEALEEFTRQIDIEGADHRTRKGNMELQAGTAGEIDHHARQGFIQRHISMAITAYALALADGLESGLAQRDAYVFHRMVGIDMQVTLGADVQM